MFTQHKIPETIVEYTAAKPSRNDYPVRIVSPPTASSCCLEEMTPLGNIHWEDDFPFVYHQCRVCGHTVRRFFEDQVGRSMGNRASPL